ncbi:MAG: amidase [Chloroflexota bacterium]|nr:amidase [Chloroflexota bacterium]
MTSDIMALSISELGAAYRRQELSPVDVTNACLASIDQTEPLLHAWVEVSADTARASARAADADFRAGVDRGPLHGVPVGIKDIFDVAGLPTRCGSPALAHQEVAASDSASVAALRAGGAVVLGKTVTQEFAAGVISPPARNPWDPARIPGGSSGGSAAALAARNCFAAMGSDTGGSIRIPAAACGVVGFKPTYASLSAEGVFPLSWSLDTVGPLARSVADARLTWSLLAGRDTPPLHTADLRGYRVGVAGPFFLDHIQPAVRDAMASTIEALRAQGAEVVESPWEEAAAARAIGFLLNRAETAVVHGAIARDEPDAFSQYNPDLRLRVAAGGIMPAELYVNSMRGRAVVRGSMAKLFREHRLNALLVPALPTTAVPAADMSITGTGLDEGIGAAWTRLTMPFNTTGQSVLAMPVGFDELGLPIGVQFAGAPGREEELFAIGQVLEAALGIQAKLPPMLRKDQ